MIAHGLRDVVVTALARLGVEPVPPAGREILLIRPDHLGDVLFVTPALRRLRRALPDARITLAIGPWSRAAVEGNPDVDEILEFPFPGFTRADSPNPVAPYRALAEFARTVRQRRAAAAVVLRDDHWWGALAVQRSGVPVRVGSDHPAMRRMLTNPVSLDGHSVERNAALVDAVATALGGVLAASVTPESDPLLWDVAPEAATAARAILTSNTVEGPYLVLAPGAGAPVKLWPATRWAAVASALSRARDVPVVLVGSPAESSIAERVRLAMTVPAVDLTGRTDFPTLGALLAGASLVLGVDSGPLHLATAVGAPTLRLYGPSSLERYGPWGDPRRHRVVSAGLRCSGCGDLSPKRPEGAGCLVAITVEQVVHAAFGMIAGV